MAEWLRFYTAFYLAGFCQLFQPLAGTTFYAALCEAHLDAVEDWCNG